MAQQECVAFLKLSILLWFTLVLLNLYRHFRSIFASFVMFLKERNKIHCLSTQLSRQTAGQLSVGTSQSHWECANFCNSWHTLQKKHSLSDHLLGHHRWAHGWHHVHSNKSQSTLWPNVQPTLLSDWVFPVPSCSPGTKSRHCAGREKNP